MFKPVIVRFMNGKYGVRKGFIFYKYFDFEGNGCYRWRTPSDLFFRDCYGTFKQAQQAILEDFDKGVPVNNGWWA